MSDTPRTGMEMALSSGMTIGEVIERLQRELSAAQARSAELEGVLREVHGCYNPRITAEQNFLLALRLARDALRRKP